MARPSFAHLWQQEDLSDVDILLHVEPGPGDSLMLLRRFPGHSQLLSLSPYFMALALRWSSTDGTDSSQQARKQINITLPDASYEPAAMAVLSGLYLVKPWSELTARQQLTHAQRVHVAVLADMWQLPAAAKDAIRILQTAAAASSDEVAAELEQLLLQSALPDCLLPVMKRVLLGRFGDLEAVWADASLQEALMQQPLPAMELLLSSDDIKVASEDTVLYTAQAYIDRLPTPEAKQAARSALAPLVRCPCLSQFWMTASVLSDDAPQLLLGELQTPLKHLMMMQLTPWPGRAQTLGLVQGPTSNNPGLLRPLLQKDIATISSAAAGMPDSWSLRGQPVLAPGGTSRPRRSFNSAPARLDLQWEVDIAAIKQAAQDSASRQTCVWLNSPVSRLFEGVKWGLSVVCSWDAEKQGSTVGVYAMAEKLPAGMYGTSPFVLRAKSAGSDVLDRHTKFRTGPEQHASMQGERGHRFWGLGAGPAPALERASDSGCQKPWCWGWRDVFCSGDAARVFNGSAWAHRGCRHLTRSCCSFTLTAASVGSKHAMGGPTSSRHPGPAVVYAVAQGSRQVVAARR